MVTFVGAVAVPWVAIVGVVCAGRMPCCQLSFSAVKRAAKNQDTSFCGWGHCNWRATEGFLSHDVGSVTRVTQLAEYLVRGGEAASAVSAGQLSPAQRQGSLGSIRSLGLSSPRAAVLLYQGPPPPLCVQRSVQIRRTSPLLCLRIMVSNHVHSALCLHVSSRT